MEGYFKSFKYYHHGIFIGHQEGIIEYGGSKKTNATVRNVSLEEFTDNCNGNKQLKRIRHANCLPPQDVVQTALNFWTKQCTWNWNLPYSILTNNCEHFATFCKTGIAESNQVKEFFFAPLPQMLIPYRYS